ncbi:MAG: hypothetical protein COB81_07655 [Flavobacteriaceae bacterium]|nr:MAG: hypothetical protein COB81_07655 [Flavobacteriaceae bacterium]
MSKVEDFLTKEEEQRIVASIQKAEKNTSGEIRVHIEKTCDKLPEERAQEVFYQLKMETTAAQNGVLFYVAVESKQFAIVGDVGIDKVVPADFWESVKDALITEFKNENYLQGIVNGIEECGLKLKTFFPYQSNDENELSDEISKG